MKISRTLFFLLWMCSSSLSFAQGVSVSESSASPDPSAILDVASDDKGLLVPRVELQSSSDASTIADPAASLLVFNLGTGGLTPAGYYYNSGSSSAPNWIRLSTGNGSGWSLSGNAGTDSLTHYIGTADNQALSIRTDELERIHIDADGRIGVGTSAPKVALDVNGAFSTRTTSSVISSNGFVLNVGNSSHILLTSSNSTPSTTWLFSLSDGQPGQYLVLEMQSGCAGLQSTGNVRLASDFAAFIEPYSVLYLKWDGTYWVELMRNGKFAAPLNPPNIYSGKQVFAYTGSNQTFTVPAYINQIYVKMWGGGGAGAHAGAGGGAAFVSGYLPVTPGANITVITAGGGRVSTGTSSIAGGFGGGGNSGSSSYGSGYVTGSGGGRSAIQITSGVDAVTAGGGGGGATRGYNFAAFGGAGGAPNGTAGGDDVNGPGGIGAGKGATTSAGGAASTGASTNSAAGSALQGSAGGNSTFGGGGGGGGYFGGSGGGGSTSTSVAKGGGGGGSSYTAGLTKAVNIAGTSGTANATYLPGNTGDSDYAPGIGTGGAHNVAGGNGLVIIYW